MNDSTQTEGGAAHEALAAVVITEMRTPLARVELAASRLRRDAATPASERLAERVSEGVREVDALLDKALRLLLPKASSGREAEPLAPALDSLRRRLGPVMQRAGIRWSAPPDALVGRMGDARTLRRAALIALRAAQHLSPDASDPVLEVEGAGERRAVVLSWRPPTSGEEVASLAAVGVEEMRREALADGVDLDLQRRGDRQRLSVWLDTAAQRPDAKVADSSISE